MIDKVVFTTAFPFDKGASMQVKVSARTARRTTRPRGGAKRPSRSERAPNSALRGIRKIIALEGSRTPLGRHEPRDAGESRSLLQCATLTDTRSIG